ncbi:hypothetical protein CsatB_023638 [Cannabis sativa]
MNPSSSGEELAILQLHKWDSSYPKLNLSEFREAFISPTRQQLLLFSRQNEALLLPLFTEDCGVTNEVKNSCSENVYYPGSALDPRRDDMPCPSGSVVDFDSGYSFECESLSGRSAYLGDVYSVAWGVCGDTYNQHKDALFRELLFVSGSHGVTVHAFCENNTNTTISRSSETASQGKFEQGEWVEWGPSVTPTSNEKVDEPFSSFHETNRNVEDVNTTNGNSESPQGDERSRGIESKLWLQSFLANVEDFESDGQRWTRFPDKSSFPPSAKVVSFHIFNSGFPFKDFVPHSNSLLKERLKEKVRDSGGDGSTKLNSSPSGPSFEPDVLSSSFSVGKSSMYKCFRVFSSNSHYVGFALTLVDPVSTDKRDESAKNLYKNLVLVAMLDKWAIQWVSLVKLEENQNIGPLVEWTDFCFFNNLLVALTSSGFVVFYSAMSGEYVVHINILQTCELEPSMELCEQTKMSVGIVRKNIEVEKVPGKRVFNRLIHASHTFMLAAADECGVVYVICADQYIVDRDEKFFPHCQHFGLGILAGWEVGGSCICCQRSYSKFSGSHQPCFSSMWSRYHSFLSYSRNHALHEIQHWNLNGEGMQQYTKCFSGFFTAYGSTNQTLHDAVGKSRRMRRIFLPTNRVNKDDSICFSPFGITRLIRKHNTKDQNGSQIVHFNLFTESAICDDSGLLMECEMHLQNGRKESFTGDAVGCTFQGCFYLVTENGLSVVLPSISVSSSFLPIEFIGYRQGSINSGSVYKEKDNMEIRNFRHPCSSWTIEVLDRVLLYDSVEEADRLCIENGWDLKIPRIRRLQLALDYLKFDDIEQCLDMLVGVNLAEEGIMRLLFAAVYLMLRKSGNDNDVSAASRLLTLASRFTTKMIRTYGLLHHENNAYLSHGFELTEVHHLPPLLHDKSQNEVGTSRRLREMAHFLEIIRNLQSRLSSKMKRPGQGLVNGGDESGLAPADLSLDESKLSILSSNTLSLETVNQNDNSFHVSAVGSNYAENLALTHMDLKAHVDPGNLHEVSAIVSQEGLLQNKILSLENPKEMIARWKIDNLDLRTVVNDALLSGRLPLAVLQLHLYHSRELISDKEPYDTFNEVRDIGRAIAYDLFLKGETGLAVATLQRLGEDVETSLKELLFGTVRRSLRAQIFDEMKRYGYLGPYEWKIMDRISLIERLYPSSCFWNAFNGRQKEYMRVPASSHLPRNNLKLLHSDVFNNFTIECGEIDGVVLGSWTNVNENPSVPVVEDENVLGGYWAAAAVWCNVWDQRTIDRIVLDQSLVIDVDVLWESQLDYYMSHGDWERVSKLLDLIPELSLEDGSLQVSLDSPQPTSTVGCAMESSLHHDYFSALEELDAVCIYIPNVKLLKFPDNIMGSTWLKMLMEEKLAKKLIFLKEFWEGTAEIVPILARAGFVTSQNEILKNAESVESSSNSNLSTDGGAFGFDTVQALHKVVIRYCVQCNLPHLLDLYLDKHMLVLDTGSLSLLLDAAGDCEWAKWLMLSRVKGCEYDASFSNARSVMSRGLVPSTDLLEVEEVICTVDDIAEGGGELAALATLMYAPVPIQNCLSSGGVKRHSNSSFQCTLENLKPTLQNFPTLWRALVSACYGQDSTSSFVGSRGKNALSDYLSWRDSVFFSSAKDTSLLQMLPCWLPKAVRRLVQLYVQGPLGWQSMSGLPLGETLRHREIDFFVNIDENAEINPISWEATIQKHVEQELCDPTLEETGLGLEHHLHRGRALSSFNRLLSVRIQNLKSEGQSGNLTQGQTNIQSDLQRLLAPLTETEISLLSSVVPLAIMHFEDSILVASCSFLLELCGLSASMLRMDIAALRRISSYYKSNGSNDNQRKLSPNTVSREGDMVESLARALADDYLHQGSVTKPKKPASLVSGKQSSRALIHVLHHLEKVSLPLMVDGKTCGSWLLSGNGDGIELRSQQKAASQHWNLVTVFCQMHQLPLSTKYLAVLARDNDWVGFLSEAQTGGYPFDAVINVASKEFSDPQLRTHILTVLKGMQSRRKASTSYADNTEKRTETFFSDEQICFPVELFRILAECEKQKNPGEALLKKAKDLSWSILAMIASCFSDVSPLSCLTVWLEITAARETSSIKVNDIASQIADSVAAAVEATNSLPAGGRVLTIHYNRRNPKRRCIMGSMPRDQSSSTDISTSPTGVKAFAAGDFMVEEERKIELHDTDEGHVSLSKMVAVLCEQHLFLPLLRAFEMFLPSCSFLPFIRALQAFSQMRLSEASAHLGSFSARIKEEPAQLQSNMGREDQIGISWISSMAVKAADAMLLTCPSPYEKRCLLKLFAVTDFGDGGSSATHYRQLYWKINLAEPSLRKDELLQLGNETLDDASLLTALEKNGLWDQARNWAKQLEASGGPWKSAVHHVTETQAESMVAEWKEFLWDVPEERVALWGHCQTLFIRYSFPALQAGLFFLKHAEAVEKDLPARELHELLLLSLQWLSGMITLSSPVYPLNLLREIETKVWLLAVESEAQVKSEGELNLTNSIRDPINKICSSIIDRTANIIIKMDNHINTSKSRSTDKHDIRDNYQGNYKNPSDANLFSTVGGTTKTKRRAKGFVTSRRPLVDTVDRSVESDEVPCSIYCKNEIPLQDENVRTGMSFSRWEEKVGTAELERAVLSLLEFGQISASKQLQHKLSPAQVPSEFILVDAALKLAALSTPSELVSISMLDEEIRLVMHSYNILTDQHQIEPVQVLESLAAIFIEGRGRGLCKRIIAVVKAANVLGLFFAEAFEKQPIELLQLLSLKAQESFEEANLLVKTHSMPAANIAQILAESFLKGLLAAHRGGYMDSQKEEGPAPLLWRFSDFLKWAELCPSEPEIGHALMRMVITGQEIPHACEVELLILSHHFYKSSACLDGVDVLVALAATRVDAYVLEGDFSCLARLITGVGNFHALNFILGILIENGQLDLLLQKYSAATDTNTSAVRGFRMAVLTSLKHFNPNDVDAFAMVYNHFDMKHETAALLESRADQSSGQWFGRKDNDQNEDLLDAMRYFIEAAEVHSSLDAGNKARRACAQASLLSLQIRMPDIQWLYLSETNARRVLVEQSRFQEALIVAEAYGLNQPSEWALVLWNQMFKPELLEFVAEFVAVLPLQSAMLTDLAKFYRAELAARGDQSQFSVWLTGGVPGDWAKYLGRSFRCLLRRTRDLKLRHSLAQMATGFGDVINTCNKLLDKVPENAGPLVLKRGHGGAYLPLM